MSKMKQFWSRRLEDIEHEIDAYALSILLCEKQIKEYEQQIQELEDEKERWKSLTVSDIEAEERYEQWKDDRS